MQAMLSQDSIKTGFTLFSVVFSKKIVKSCNSYFHMPDTTPYYNITAGLLYTLVKLQPGTLKTRK